MRHDLLQPIVGTMYVPSLADQLRLVRALAGTTHRRGVEDLQNAAAYVEQVALEALAALKALLTEVDNEIEQRQTSGLDEYWQDLKALSDAAHAAVASAEGRHPVSGTSSDPVCRQCATQEHGSPKLPDTCAVPIFCAIGSDQGGGDA